VIERQFHICRRRRQDTRVRSAQGARDSGTRDTRGSARSAGAQRVGAGDRQAAPPAVPEQVRFA
jgi:hypothetical protein